MLPTSITTTTGSGDDETVFGDKRPTGASSVIYYGPSPNNDLAGRPTVRVSHETTRQGVERSLVSVNIPYRKDDGSYEQGETCNMTLNRKVNADVDRADLVVEMIAELLAQAGFRSEIVTSST